MTVPTVTYLRSFPFTGWLAAAALGVTTLGVAAVAGDGNLDRTVPRTDVTALVDDVAEIRAAGARAATGGDISPVIALVEVAEARWDSDGPGGQEGRSEQIGDALRAVRAAAEAVAEDRDQSAVSALGRAMDALTFVAVDPGAALEPTGPSTTVSDEAPGTTSTTVSDEARRERLEDRLEEVGLDPAELPSHQP